MEMINRRIMASDFFEIINGFEKQGKACDACQQE
jgi:hypothetical protein